ncbi:MAG: S53 family serine peptidase [Steroidobacteraceae bacterium]
MHRLQSMGAADENTLAHFNVYLPLTHTDALKKLLQSQTDTTSANYHQWLTPAQFKQQFGPSRSDVAKAKSLLESAGFTIVAERTQNLVVEGPVSAVERTFNAQIERVKTKSGHIKLAASEGHLNLPQALSAMGAVIPEFTPRLEAHVHSRVLQQTLATPKLVQEGSGSGAPSDRLANDFSFFYANDLNEAYQLPAFSAEVTPLFSRKQLQIAGVGAHIGIVISSVIDPADLAASFNSTVGIGPTLDVQAYSANSNLPVPTVKIREVGAGSGPFSLNNGAAAEASLDTQMSLGTAPGAEETLYDMPDLSNDSVAEAYALVDEDNAVDVVSSSFGQCELDFTAAYNNGTDFTSIPKTFHALFQQGNAQGITFLASSGDNGAPDCVSQAFADAPGVINGTDFVLGVENPASDPNITAVGGTNLQTAATPTVNDVTYVSENADFDPRIPAVFSFDGQTATVGNNTWGSGGGFSKIFSKPLYQFLVNTGSKMHRSVPDVSLMMGGCPGDADLGAQDCTQLPRSAAIVWIGGGPALLIGTSASAPEMAGVLALAVELNRSRLGNVNPLIYSLSAVQSIFGGVHAPKALQFFHRNISGDNNGYSVKSGQAYSEVLGNSTLDVKNFLLQQRAPAAGAPGTPSNP